MTGDLVHEMPAENPRLTSRFLLHNLSVCLLCVLCVVDNRTTCIVLGAAVSHVFHVHPFLSPNPWVFSSLLLLRRQFLSHTDAEEPLEINRKEAPMLSITLSSRTAVPNPSIQWWNLNAGGKPVAQAKREEEEGLTWSPFTVLRLCSCFYVYVVCPLLCVPWLHTPSSLCTWHNEKSCCRRLPPVLLIHQHT